MSCSTRQVSSCTVGLQQVRRGAEFLTGVVVLHEVTTQSYRLGEHLSQIDITDGDADGRRVALWPSSAEPGYLVLQGRNGYATELVAHRIIAEQYGVRSYVQSVQVLDLCIIEFLYVSTHNYKYL